MTEPTAAPYVDCPEWVGDATMSLAELEAMIPRLKARYGARAVVRFDAGANNVSVMVRPSKKIRPEKGGRTKTCRLCEGNGDTVYGDLCASCGGAGRVRAGPPPGLPPKEHFERYVRAQDGGRYNMYDPRACRATGLSREDYGAVMDNYDALCEEYPEVINQK
jgi:hypothetical protein